jgi:hypothetical protein
VRDYVVGRGHTGSPGSDGASPYPELRPTCAGVPHSTAVPFPKMTFHPTVGASLAAVAREANISRMLQYWLERYRASDRF